MQNFSQTWLLIVFVALVGSSCKIVDLFIDSTKPELSTIKPVEFKKNGLAFSYADNWTIVEDEIEGDGSGYLKAQDSYSSEFAITVGAEGKDFDLEQFIEADFQKIKDFMKTVPTARVSDFKKADASRRINGRSVKGKQLKFTSTVAGYESSLSSEFFLIEVGGRKAVVNVLATEEEWPAALKEFQMILDNIEFKEPTGGLGRDK